MAAAFCAVAASTALAQQATVRTTPTASATQKDAVASAVQAGKQPQEWSQDEIGLAQARCTVLLKGLDVVVVPETPWRDGECGTPAPMKLISIGKRQQVTLSPPVTITCDMIAALHKWVERDLQPLARKHLGAPLTNIETMSAYSCRNAYGRAKTRLSEHGRANALDIRSFVAARGQAAMVVADWGLTQREAREIAEAAAKSKAAAAETKTGPTTGATGDASTGTTGQGFTADPGHTGLKVVIPGISIQMPGGSAGRSGHMGFVPPNRLGGPKAQAEPGTLGAGKMDFLRAAHRTACKVFGTVLGPEANKAHENHFHVDMADRKGIAICE